MLSILSYEQDARADSIFIRIVNNHSPVYHSVFNFYSCVFNHRQKRDACASKEIQVSVSNSNLLSI